MSLSLPGLLRVVSIWAAPTRLPPPLPPPPPTTAPPAAGGGGCAGACGAAGAGCGTGCARLRSPLGRGAQGLPLGTSRRRRMGREQGGEGRRNRQLLPPPGGEGGGPPPVPEYRMRGDGSGDEIVQPFLLAGRGVYVWIFYFPAAAKGISAHLRRCSQKSPSAASAFPCVPAREWWGGRGVSRGRLRQKRCPVPSCSPGRAVLGKGELSAFYWRAAEPLRRFNPLPRGASPALRPRFCRPKSAELTRPLRIVPLSFCHFTPNICKAKCVRGNTASIPLPPAVRKCSLLRVASYLINTK